MVEVIRIPPPRQFPDHLKWKVGAPPSLPSPFENDHRWQTVSFDLEIDLTRSPGSPVSVYVKSMNQPVVFQLPKPLKVGRLRKKVTHYSTDMVIEQAFTKPSTKFSFRCYYRRKWALSEGIDRAILEYTFTVGEKRRASFGPNQIVIPLVRRVPK